MISNLHPTTLGALLLLATWSLKPSAAFAAGGPVGQEGARLADSVFVFVPFQDESGFGGKWKLSDDLPRFLAAYMRERFDVRTIYPAMVRQYDEVRGTLSSAPNDRTSLAAYAEHFGARYLVIGTVSDFSISRFIAGDQTLGDYEAFSAEVKFGFDVYDATNLAQQMEGPPVCESEASGAVKDRALGLTLFGRQSDRTNQYYSLDNLYFGGAEFLRTIIGEAMVKSADDFSVKIERAMPSLRRTVPMADTGAALNPAPEDTTIALHRTVIKGEILSVDRDEVFINLGSDDGIAEGQSIRVYGPGKELRDPKTGAMLGTADVEVGEIQVVEVRASHLSLARIIKGGAAVQVHHRIRLTVVR